MDGRSDIREFLVSRRARLTPQAAGLPDFGGRRRVPGLRREEVALLAGMSVEYYVRLERGNAKGVSQAVLDGISRALQLDDAEHAHLGELVRAANPGVRSPRGSRSAPQQVSPGVRRLLDAMSGVPAIVQNGRLDILAANALAAALFSDVDLSPTAGPNFARFVFTQPSAQRFYRDWEDAAHQTVALLRAETGRAPYDRVLAQLVDELSAESAAFRVMWAAHDVREHRTGIKLVRHPVVGDLDLAYEGMQLSNDRALLLIAYTAEAGSRSQDGLQMLASWTATNEGTEPVPR
ncbi:helix-turn-helix domain-containing protein [Microbacterium sp. DT81.1]|uniref:helix-turn-helix domain-containing protein n=1 Tax=Microbacterium sp. DT81.1 TaxID=3393413 RepID=UPI003CED8B26